MDELAQAASMVQVPGVDLGGIIAMIVTATEKARENKAECEELKSRAVLISDRVKEAKLQSGDPWKAGLDAALQEAHELIVSCETSNVASRIFMASTRAKKLQDVQAKIDFYIGLFPLVGHSALISGHNEIKAFQSNQSAAQHLPSQTDRDLAISRMAEQYTRNQIMMATNNFNDDKKIGEGFSGAVVYKGNLIDGKEVVVKHLKSTTTPLWRFMKDSFRTEVSILSRLDHGHIIRLHGARLEEEECMVVYEYMANGSLHDHLHAASSLFKKKNAASSQVTTSWKTRVEVLLAVAKAIEYLTSNACFSPVIHNNIKSSNILFDANWVAHVKGFRSSVEWDPPRHPNTGTQGNADPEHAYPDGVISPASDVYNFGVVTLETLTGKQPASAGNGRPSLLKFAPLIIQNGSPKDMKDMLDTRPERNLVLESSDSDDPDFPRPIIADVTEPEPETERDRETIFEALKLVADTAASCVCLKAENRPLISVVVNKLETALNLFGQ